MADPAIKGLQVYVVGGAVRDALLGLPPGDRDWVVVGASPQAMVARGFIPVGGDFPVFLHPHTKEEYALARTERKSGRGYRGFTFYTGSDVTLEDDLRRRDLTVNAIAQAPDGELIDPLNGQADVHAGVLRHVGKAFVEDPVRLLRLGRFAAQFPTFEVADETLTLARKLVTQGEVDALVPERVWQELAKGLMASAPGRMLDVLEQTGALPRVLPGLVVAADTAEELACAVRNDLPLAGRFALLCRHTQPIKPLCERLRVPKACCDYAVLLPQLLHDIARLEGVSPMLLTGQDAQHILDALMQADALRRPDRFLDLLRVAECVRPVAVSAWSAYLGVVQEVDAGAVARTVSEPKAIRRALYQARLQALVDVYSGG